MAIMELLVSSIAESLVSSIAEKLASKAYQEICLAWGIEVELNKLQKILVNIKAVLSDAEKQQIRKEQVRVWLSDLKNALYEAEDVLDEFECESVKRQVVKQYWTTPQKVGRFFSCSNPLAFRFKMGNKIKQIRERLDEIADYKNKFHLSMEKEESSHAMYTKRDTHSFVNVSDIIGRDNDKENIIELLLRHGDDRKISVIPIVGIGGLGKTTLAKLVYNDKRISEDFKLKMWVCVSEDFNVKILVEKIIKSAGNSKENIKNLEMEQLQKELRVSIDDKKYLLILDDVWNEDSMKWNELEELLREGANGSKILVTTRSNQVASVMGTVPAYQLSGLHDDQSVKLFVKFAFKEGEENQYPNLLKIGNEIAKKCKGVPLVIKTLASLLFLKTDEKHWKSIRDNEIWELEEEKENKILLALRLSYEHLPSYLKRCFVYCSFYPKDTVYLSSELIQFWMAYGLIQSRNEKEELEDIGLRYLKELASRSFFQDIDYEFGDLFGFKMHDLLHDLALSFVQNEHKIVSSNTQNISKSVRHLLFGDLTSLPNGLAMKLQGLDRVQTISSADLEKGLNSQLVINFLRLSSTFQYLRMLNLSDSEFEELPERIGVLKHLRFINIFGNCNIRKLPNSICKLHCLQTLMINECSNIEELPKDIRYMISLRHLWLTTKQKHLPKKGIGCLKSLRFLAIIECENLEYLFEDMQDLTKLRTLIIMRCDSLLSLPQSMKSLIALEFLWIGSCANLDLTMKEGKDNNSDFSRFSIQKLVLESLPKLVDLPQWLLQGSTNSLQFLHLLWCWNLKELPLCLKDIASLQELKIEDCGELTERCQREKGEDWSKVTRIPSIILDAKIIKSTHNK